jgi:pyridoxamine 5'-phosphate oxidase
MNLSDMRREYTQRGLSRDDLSPSPIHQFARWFQDAVDGQLLEPNAMTLATVGAAGRPTARTVLLKYFDESGFVFFTNKESRKARQMAENPNVALLFCWVGLERQVAMTGTAEEVSAVESMRYFLSRPRESQIAAWVSQQSHVISSRKILLMKFDEMRRKFRDGKVPLPDHWGGYRVRPVTIEFWQGRENRLHDRFQYSRTDDGSWRIERLAP